MTEIIQNSPDNYQFSAVHLTDFMGQPKGLWVLTLTEACIAFGLYGMESILLPYIQYLLHNYLALPSLDLLNQQNLSKIWGANLFFGITQSIYQPTSISGLGAGLMGMYLGFLTAVPLIGAFIADKYLGRTRSIIIGIGIAFLGIALLSQLSSFVIALGLTLTGIGLAGSMKAQVGSLYNTNDRRRSDAYQIYSLGIQLAVIISPLLCAWIALKSWKLAFTFASLGLLLAAIIYLLGIKHLPKDKKTTVKTNSVLTSHDYKKIGLIAVLVILFSLGDLPNSEIFDGYLIWAKNSYNLELFGYSFPVSDLFSLDGLLSSLTAILVLWFCQFCDRRAKAPLDDMTKIIIGTSIGMIAPLVLAYASYQYPNPHEVSLWWGILFHTINDFGAALSSALGMSLVSRIAPSSVGTIMISFFNLHLCFSNLLVGKLSSLIETISPTLFWLIHSMSAGVSLIGLALIAKFAKNALSTERETTL